MLEKLRIKITILASLIATAFAYFYNVDLLRTCYTIVIIIVVFYFLGGFIEIFLQNQFNKIEEDKKVEEDNSLDKSENNENIEEDNSNNVNLEESNL